MKNKIKYQLTEEEKLYLCNLESPKGNIKDWNSSLFNFIVKDNWITKEESIKNQKYILNKYDFSKMKTEVSGYEEALKSCFSKKTELIKFDSNTTDKEIDDFFDSI